MKNRESGKDPQRPSNQSENSGDCYHIDPSIETVAPLERV